MPAARKPKPEATEPVEVQEEAVSGDAGAAALQALTDEATSQGYFGVTNDPNPNEAYSLKSGPDSPSAASVNPATRPKQKEA